VVVRPPFEIFEQPDEFWFSAIISNAGLCRIVSCESFMSEFAIIISFGMIRAPACVNGTRLSVTNACYRGIAVALNLAVTRQGMG
jgi:hypothetical protein